MAEAKRIKIVASNVADGIFSIYSPPDTDGKQEVAATYTFDDAAFQASPHFAAMDRLLRLTGYSYLASNGYNRMDEDERTVEKVQAVFTKLTASLMDGSYMPGRTLVDREPTDIILAIAEATGQTVAAIQDHVDNDVHKDGDGNPVLDARGRTKRIFTDAVLRKMEDDPKIKPILARLAAERAKRLADELRQGKGKPAPTTGALDLFAAPAQGEAQGEEESDEGQQEAAN